MKSTITVALIVCGMSLVCVPPLSDSLIGWQALQHQQIMATGPHPIPGISFQLMSEEYRASCFTLGALMIGVAVFASWGGRQSS